MIKNLLRGLFENGKVQTTTPKAKVLKANAESLIENSIKADNDLLLRRKLQLVFGDAELVEKFKEYIAKENHGVSIVKVGFRSGDNAELSKVELMGLKKVKKAKKEDKVVGEKKNKKVDEKDTAGIEKKTTKRNIEPKKRTVVKKERAHSRSGL
jgi:large subunit ribosomal protein L17